MKNLWIIGTAISIAFSINGCGKQAQAETNPSIMINETTVAETTTEAETTETPTISETTKADMGKYGEYGKEAYELLKLNWVNGIYENEGELREQAPTILGSISDENLESIIQELLSLDRPNSTPQSTQNTGESLTVPTSVESTKAPQPDPTQAVENTTPTPAPQPTQAETQSQVSNTPPAAISQEEFDKILEEAGLSQDPEKAANSVTISDGIYLDPDAGEGYNWH